MNTATLHRAMNKRRDFAKTFIGCTCLLALGNLFFFLGFRRPAAAAAIIGTAGAIASACAWWLEPRRVGIRVAKSAAKAGMLLPLGDQLTVMLGKSKVVVPWSSMRRLMAFKRDLLYYDNICILIEGQDGPLAQIDEDMVGWQTLMEKLPERLPGMRPWQEWWPTVAFPAFESNATVIWERATPL